MDLVNNDLANTIGNLLNRTASMSRKWFSGSLPSISGDIQANHPLKKSTEQTIDLVRQSIPSLAFQNAAEAVLQLAIEANGYLNEQAPWSLMKQPGHEQKVGDDLYAVLDCCRVIGLLLQPLVPGLSARILAQLNLHPCDGCWNSALSWGQLEPSANLPKPEPVMQRLELESPL